MRDHGVFNIVFSSSATVYGDPQYLPLDEKHPAGGCTNPYGKTKYFIEEIMSDLCVADKVGWNYHPTRCGCHWYEFLQCASIVQPGIK